MYSDPVTMTMQIKARTTLNYKNLDTIFYQTCNCNAYDTDGDVHLRHGLL